MFFFGLTGLLPGGYNYYYTIKTFYMEDSGNEYIKECFVNSGSIKMGPIILKKFSKKCVTFSAFVLLNI